MNYEIVSFFFGIELRWDKLGFLRIPTNEAVSVLFLQFHEIKGHAVNVVAAFFLNSPPRFADACDYWIVGVHYSS